MKLNDMKFLAGIVFVFIGFGLGVDEGTNGWEFFIEKILAGGVFAFGMYMMHRAITARKEARNKMPQKLHYEKPDYLIEIEEPVKKSIDIRYTLMLANDGGMLIMDGGERFIKEDDKKLAEGLGWDIIEKMQEQSMSDAKITIKIEEL